MTRKWYGEGCHRHAVFNNSLTDDLTNTQYVANAMLGLPFYIGMGKSMIEQVVDALVEIAANSSRDELTEEKKHASGL